MMTMVCGHRADTNSDLEVNSRQEERRVYSWSERGIKYGREDGEDPNKNRTREKRSERRRGSEEEWSDECE